ncbi:MULTISPECIES: MBL fold metallo-hydrolase [Bradyrhizobium]|jgi:ribonuclease BN (tRNA processing enzyme)|uniref:MBL fold metallo-hydrolase n=1 Tax=Bradyrhizobium TaxID=374 RepID=UPI000481AC41|nr:MULTISPECIES: MBL fold metallo-hydrolase [Bradyrhizobium]MCS3445721.1 ribonuclease BN (tRNA processing enzyme) [Bradyrhizobium elkanii]MCS3563148.1 ribonuclease BN (tRNA processing enzyme) [Bradyrhizobium elkanii]MCW2147017.1 ribonuclease BN (tRNA processing enzyme) [Bradyrhizobium elkanii]MCW2353907.1 ribonuclease BN (tRNA processing enzyme) [Bradyrhizobium elkanii]MCW2379847.1 ribonuclease BN (tRNA processing enzyme) [Bradyrhizobium elkanii]
MQLRFVGCGDAFGSGGRFNTCFHVSGARSNFLIDCGASSLPAMKRLEIDGDAIDLILITHFHGDHFAGLPFFLLDAQFSRRTRPLVIAGPQGIETKLPAVMEVMFEHSSKTRQRFDLSVVTLAPRETRSFGEVIVTPYPVVHGESGGPFLAYRVGAEGRIISYSADTEWTDALIPAAQDADLFIAEAYMYDKMVKNHLSLKTLEAHLPAINAKRVVLTHMSDDMLGRIDDLPYTAASDGMVVVL